MHAGEFEIEVRHLARIHGRSETLFVVPAINCALKACTIRRLPRATFRRTFIIGRPADRGSASRDQQFRHRLCAGMTKTCPWPRDIIARSIPRNSSQSPVRFQLGRLWRPERHGAFVAARSLLYYFFASYTARQLVGISVGISNTPRLKLTQIQMVMALGGYRPGAPS